MVFDNRRKQDIGENMLIVDRRIAVAPAGPEGQRRVVLVLKAEGDDIDVFPAEPARIRGRLKFHRLYGFFVNELVVQRDNGVRKYFFDIPPTWKTGGRSTVLGKAWVYFSNRCIHTLDW